MNVSNKTTQEIINAIGVKLDDLETQITEQIKTAFLAAHPLTDIDNAAALRAWLLYAATNGHIT